MYISERNRKDRERSELFDQNYLIGTEHISVHPRTEQTNICVAKIFLYGRILVFDRQKEYKNKSQNPEFMEYVQEFLD